MEWKHEQLRTAMVLDRMCDWGAHRTVNEWPRELVAPGPIPSITDSLRCSRSSTLTLPQLITALKERVGGGVNGKALDMLNLKAYVRCFPDSFQLHSGRSPNGRPLDVVELRHPGEPHAMACLGMAPVQAHPDGLSRVERQVTWPGANGRAPPPPPRAAAPAPSHPSLARMGFDSVAIPPGAGISPPPLSALSATMPASSTNFSQLFDPAASPVNRLEPKDLFGASSAAKGWDDERTTLAKIHDLWSDKQVASPPPPPPREGAQDEARRLFMQHYDLERLFYEAVDRAMVHKVPSPIEYVARELLRSAAF